jgi:predicted MFS family arabinose efflux permease
MRGGAEMVGLLLAIQAAAWLIWTMPAGVLVDRLPRRHVLLAGALLASLGLSLAAAGVAMAQAGLLAAGAFLGSAGVVVFVLVASAIVPDLVPRQGLAAANARLELARACATIAAPLAVGALAAGQALILAFVLATLLAGLTAHLLSRLPLEAASQPAAPRRPALRQIRDGAVFIAKAPNLRAIDACAVLWNIGFFALVAAFVPFALAVLQLDTLRIGLVQSGYGLGLVAGALLAPWAMARLGWGTVLLLGPGLSAVAPALLLAAPGSASWLVTALGLLAHFALGFGPMMWMVCRTSVVQSCTPRDMLGTVSASMQLAVFGVRPLGALMGGALGAGLSLDAGIAFAGGMFLLSVLAMAGAGPRLRSAAAGRD